jgi:uncharacterized membrane protein YfcA
MDAPTIAIAALILFGAYLIRGMSGFGSGLVSIPLLAHLLPLQFVVPWILVLDLSASLALGGSARDRAAIRWGEIGWLLPGSLVGVLLGIFLLVRLPKEPLLIGLGLFVVGFGVRSLLHLQGTRTIPRGWALPAGLLGGTVGAMFGTGGPPYVIYLSHRIRDTRAIRATFSGLFLLDGGLRLVVFGIAGLLLHEDLLVACIAGVPIVALGLMAGHRIHLGLSQQQMLRLIGVLLIASGGSLIARAW